MLLTCFLFLVSAGAIYFACEYFVNGVEWFGRKLSLGATTTGTVLAAFGTALPESAVTFVAVIFGKTPEARDIGVGAALGGPLVLATIAYAVVGIALYLGRKRLKRRDARGGSRGAQQTDAVPECANLNPAESNGEVEPRTQQGDNKGVSRQHPANGIDQRLEPTFHVTHLLSQPLEGPLKIEG